MCSKYLFYAVILNLIGPFCTVVFPFQFSLLQCFWLILLGLFVILILTRITHSIYLQN